jgi:hypothetical protein
MSPLPIADWQAALAEMDAALGATLAALDRYEAGWTALLAGEVPPVESAAHRVLLDRLEGRAGEWDARLQAAEELAASVERQLNDREAAVGRWREMVADCQRVIQQGAESPVTSADGQ